jgi:hypothetical protein
MKRNEDVRVNIIFKMMEVVGMTRMKNEKR